MTQSLEEKMSALYSSGLQTCLPIKIEWNGIGTDVGAENTFELVIGDEPGVIPNTKSAHSRRV